MVLVVDVVEVCRVADVVVDVVVEEEVDVKSVSTLTTKQQHQQLSIIQQSTIIER